MSPPSVTAADNELMARLDPVWRNTYWIKNALELCDGLWRHAAEMPTQHHHFFSLVQDFALDSAVLRIYKLFDRSNPDYEKDTIPDVMDYTKTHFTDKYISRLDTRTLVDLGVGHADATRIVTAFKTGSHFSQTRDDLFTIVEDLMPTPKNNSSLKQIFLIRNKVVAHQERVGCALKEQVKYRPSVDDIEKINNWASNFCRLIACMLSDDITLLPHAVSARMAALNVVAKVLDKNFDPSKDGAAYQAWDDFYKRQ